MTAQNNGDGAKTIIDGDATRRPREKAKKSVTPPPINSSDFSAKLTFVG